MLYRKISLSIVCLTCGCICLSGVCGSNLVGQTNALPGSDVNTQRFASPASEEAADDDQLLLREGAKLTSRSGVFRHDGEGATFITTDGYELSTLPNLNLERIIRTLKSSDEAESIRWSVDGLVTEFNGRNYLLISRAVYKSSAPPPPPTQLAN